MADVTTSPSTHTASAVGDVSAAPAASTADRRARPSLGEQPLGPLDGRYRAYVAPLAQYLSEAALNRERLRVEVAWLVHLAESRAVPGLWPLDGEEIASLRGIVDAFGAEAVDELAAIERITLHDVKAIEYYLKRALDGTS